MEYAIGFLVWLGIAALAILLVGMKYRRTPGTTMAVAVVLTILGTFVGGMLGVSGYVYHDPNPLRIGGLIGAAAGGLLFAAMYFWVARKLV